MSSTYDPETRAKAVRLALITAAATRASGRRSSPSRSDWGLTRDAAELVPAKVTTGSVTGVSTEAAQEIRELKRRNRELEETIEILKAATSFFVRETDPRTSRR
jgi:transposase-like protein